MGGIMLEQLEKNVRDVGVRQGLWKSGSRLGLMVSGGGDSMAMMHIMVSLAKSLALHLEVLHFNHGLRPEAEQEAEWVARQARALGLVCHVKHTDHLREIRSGFQAAARRWRYESALVWAEENQMEAVVTGHQGEDQAETIILKLLRGCRLWGLQGMAPRSGRVIRPLLGCAGADLKAYLRKREISWLEDPSNQKTEYKRNRVRKQLMPLLDDLAGGAIAQRLKNLQRQAESIQGLINTFPSPAMSSPFEKPHWISAEGLEALPEAVVMEILGGFIESRAPGLVPFQVLEAAFACLKKSNPAWALHLSGGRTLKRRGERLLLETRDRAESVKQEASGTGVEKTEAVLTGSVLNLPALNLSVGAWALELMGAPPFIFENVPGELSLYNIPDGASVQVRTRKPGDRFHPGWRNNPTKLKDFLRDQGVPLWGRDHIWLVVMKEKVLAVLPDESVRGFVAKDFENPEGKSPPLGVFPKKKGA